MAIHITSHHQMVCRNAQINKTHGNLLMFFVGCSHENKNSFRQGSNTYCCKVKSLQLKIFSISTTKHQNTGLFSQQELAEHWKSHQKTRSGLKNISVSFTKAKVLQSAWLQLLKQKQPSSTAQYLNVMSFSPVEV